MESVINSTFDFCTAVYQSSLTITRLQPNLKFGVNFSRNSLFGTVKYRIAYASACVKYTVGKLYLNPNTTPSRKKYIQPRIIRCDSGILLYAHFNHPCTDLSPRGIIQPAVR